MSLDGLIFYAFGLSLGIFITIMGIVTGHTAISAWLLIVVLLLLLAPLVGEVLRKAMFLVETPTVHLDEADYVARIRSIAAEGLEAMVDVVERDRNRNFDAEFGTD